LRINVAILILIFFFIAWCKSEDALTNYLQVLASLSSTIVPLMAEQSVSERQAD